MNNLLKHIPGLRSGDKKKQGAAGVYYLISVLAFLYSPSLMFIMLAIPLVVVGAMDLFTYKQKQIPLKEALRVLVVGMAMLVVSFMVQQPEYNEAAILADNPPAAVETNSMPQPAMPSESSDISDEQQRLHQDTQVLLQDPNTYPSDFLLVLEVMAKAWKDLEIDPDTYEKIRGNTLADQAVRDLLAFREDSTELPLILYQSIQQFIATDPQYEALVSSYFDEKDYFEVKRELKDGNWTLVITSTIGKEKAPQPFSVSLD